MKFTMSCLCCKRPSKTPPIIDVEKIIQDHVWRMVKGDRSPLVRVFMRRCDYDIEVPQNYFHFKDIKEEIIEDKKPSPKNPTKSKMEKEKTIPEVSVLCTEFRNNTETEQTFQFRFQKTRSASVNVTCQTGFTIGGKAHFKLGLPKPLNDSSFDAEINFQYQVTKTEGETFNESVTIESNSEIHVFKQRKYTAKVALAEHQFSGKFRVETLMAMPSGSAPIFVRKKRNKELYCIESISNLKPVFADLPVEFVDVSEKGQRVACYAVKFVTTGVIEGVRLLDQKIYLDSEKLDESDNFTVRMPKRLDDFVSAPGKDKMSDVTESSVDSASEESGQGTLSHQRETKILRGPEIPQIITTAPSSIETSTGTDDSCRSCDHPSPTETTHPSELIKIKHSDHQPSNPSQDIGADDKNITTKFNITGDSNVKEISRNTSAPTAEPESSDLISFSYDRPIDNRGAKNDARQINIKTNKNIKQTSTESEDKQKMGKDEDVKKTSGSEKDAEQMTKFKSDTNQPAKFASDIKQTPKIESGVKEKGKDVDIKWTPGSEKNTKSTTKSESDMKQTARFKSDVKQITRTDSNSEQTTRQESSRRQTTRSESEQITRPSLNRRQTTEMEDKRQTRETEADKTETRKNTVEKRTQSAEIKVQPTKPAPRHVIDVDSGFAERRAKAKKSLKGEVFTRHSLPIAPNDELRKAILSEEKRRSLSKLTKCTSV